MDTPKKPTGFAALSPERRKEIASLGGRRAHLLGVAHQWDAAEAKAAGKKGGKVSKAARAREVAAANRKVA